MFPGDLTRKDPAVMCPGDGGEMRQVRILSHYGQPIFLDQCVKCGGIWFDESELFRSKRGEAERIESLDEETLRRPSEVKTPFLVCPRDGAPLYQFHDRYFPQGIILERCPTCNGIWLNRGAFTEFQMARRDLQPSKEKSLKDAEFEEEVKKLLASSRSDKGNDVVGRLRKFLSTPVDEGSLSPDVPVGKPSTAANTAGIALEVLLTLLRIFVFRA